MNLVTLDPVVSEEKSCGQRTEDAHSISPGAFGSGELKSVFSRTDGDET